MSYFPDCCFQVFLFLTAGFEHLIMMSFDIIFFKFLVYNFHHSWKVLSFYFFKYFGSLSSSGSYSYMNISHWKSHRSRMFFLQTFSLSVFHFG